MRRRQILQIGGGLLLAGFPAVRSALSADTVEIAMRGNQDGSKVWFDPIGVHIAPGQTVRWTNRDPGNSHTATAYHPKNADHPRRIPQNAAPWDSDYLLPDQTFTIRLLAEGVYDYFCLPHEMAGMVGRIVVGQPNATSDYDHGGAQSSNTLTDELRKAFPSVEDILRRGTVRVE